ncbi:LOW QUALITY PROTEIN: fibroblast growth factor-binding protein 2b [Puntigrus tetrazona]|uniref:LOW QUALITY PROTEIN: fibroblast growth factor-binding protein 2b n=1 Tax=Puntigrus tetrazona TaxID=1606681 RepID=UPI001C895690|nr:LOW QUALITY PROTEIN: fibroblast growth factor-binding protein 2b [Puntigrus tetrazona]
MFSSTNSADSNFRFVSMVTGGSRLESRGPPSLEGCVHSALLKDPFVGLVFIKTACTSNTFPSPFYTSIMRAVCSAAFLLVCFVWATNAQAQNSSNQGNGINHVERQQQPPKSSIWDEPIRFNTKAKDSCSMAIFGQTNFTKLRVSCKSKGKSYWCDFLGKPNLCRPYSSNPRHFFTQIMWDMRKLQNACQGPRVYKPQMCRSASDEVQMVFHASWPKISIPKPTQVKSSITPTKPPSSKQQPKPQQPAKPAARPVKPAVTKTVTPRKSVKTITARPTAADETQATKMAEEYCWKSLQGICEYFISWFQN